jgi:RHS repeat-associated protein
MRLTHLCSLLPIFSLLFTSTANSQNSQSYLNDTGGTPYGINIPVESGFINVSNGNLHLEFPFASPPQRGALSVNERLVYDSRIWMFSPFGTHGSYHWWPYNVYGSSQLAGGWRFITGGETGVVGYTVISTNQSECPGEPDQGLLVSSSSANPIWTDPNGTSHPFNAVLYQQDTTACPNGAFTQSLIPGTATDGSGYSIKDDGNGNPLVIDNNGMQVYPQIIDRYGNYLTTDANGNLIDDTGRVPVVVTQSGNITYYDVLAPNGPINNNGTRVRYTVTTAQVPVSTDFEPQSQSDIYPWTSPGLLTPVQSILLPNGSQYTFSYDGNGELSSVTLPTGGVVTYGYTDFVDSSNTENRWLSSRTVGSNPSMTFTPAVVTACVNYSTGCVEQIKVHKPSGDETLYQLTLINGAWNTGVTTYTGSAASGQKLVQTTNVNSYTNGCVSMLQCVGANYPTQSVSTTDLSGSGLQSQTEYLYNSLGKIAAVKEWDYYFSSNGPPSLPTRETDYSYTGLDPYQITVLDRNGIPATQTTYSFTSNANSTAGISQHGSQNAGGPYLHAVSRSGSVTTYTLDDTGQVVSIVDPNQNPATNITYQCANSLPYQVANPLNQTTTYGYDCNSGAIAGVQDPNDAAAGRPGTTYAYEAVAGRIQSVNRPDGGQTNYSYPSIAEVDSAITATPNPTITSADIADSYGRQYQHVQSGVSGETTYDINSRVLCVTNPHFTTSSSSDGNICITSYDGLDRPLIQTEQDNSTRTWSYSGNVATVADETGYAWQQASDAFGHLVNVVEPTGASTAYSYNALGNLTNVTQTGVSGESQRSRTFAYDSLSRLITAINPESGTVCYGQWNGSNCVNGYDANGNLIAQTDARGIVTSYSYDSLNRITLKTSSGASGVPGFYYAYGYDSGTNGIGRLSFHSNYVNADTVYTYDVMGRVSSQANWTPSSPNNSSIVTAATYDLAGHITSLTYPDGRTVNQTWDGRSNLTQIADGGGYNYLTTQSSYWPNGAPSTLWYGNGVANGYHLNNRLQIQESGQTRVASGAPGTYSVSVPLSVKEYCFGPATSALSGSIPGCHSFNIGNNGNVWQILDILKDSSSQTIGYDSLNRVTSFLRSDGSMQQSYAYDSFGNLNQTSPGTLQTNLGFNEQNKINSGGYGYDLAGNITTVFNGVGYNQYGYDAENKLVNVNSGAATYTYDANGDRVRKDVSPNWTEYVRFNGQVLAEKSSDGFWSDYIYANGQRIARADSYDIRIHMSGTNCPSCVSNPNTFVGVTSLTAANNYTVRTGDVLSWRQYQDGSTTGGLLIFFKDGTNATASTDTDGELIDQDATMNSWHMRTIDMSPYAGKTIQLVDPFQWSGAPAGNWDIYYGDITLTSTDGTSIPIYNRAIATLSLATNAAVSNFSAITEKVATSPNPYVTTFYSGDQIGSARMLTDYGGWPVSSDTYYPFGPEPTPPGDNNHYRFTGQERDNESGLDYFNARHYSITTGRFMSPDPYSGSMDLANPQSLNRYSYVGNMPLTFTDPSGLDPITISVIAYCGGASGACAAGFSNPITAIALGGVFVGAVLADLFTGGFFEHPQLKESKTPRPKNKNCPAVPAHPPNASVNANMLQTSASVPVPDQYGGLLTEKTIQGGMWFHNVCCWSSLWGYQSQGVQYDDFGNFNYGATGIALGIPRPLLLGFAGIVKNFNYWEKGQLNPYWSKAWMNATSKTKMIDQGITHAKNGCPD